MFKSFIWIRPLTMGGAIALSLFSPSPGFSKPTCQHRDMLTNDTPASTTRTVKLEQFGLQINIPENFRTLLYNNGNVDILSPGDFQIMQCWAQGQPVATEVLPFLSFQLHPNPKNLKADEFAQQLSQSYVSPLQRERVNQLDLAMRESTAGYDIAYGWYQLPSTQGIVQVSANTRHDIYNTIEQAQLIGGGFDTIDPILNKAFDSISNPDSHTSQITISRVHDSAENPTKLTLTITRKGYLDDSVNGHQTIIQMKKLPDRTWTVTDNQTLIICKPGRGSQTGSTKSCL